MSSAWAATSPGAIPLASAVRTTLGSNCASHCASSADDESEGLDAVIEMVRSLLIADHGGFRFDAAHQRGVGYALSLMFMPGVPRTENAPGLGQGRILALAGCRFVPERQYRGGKGEGDDLSPR